MAGLTEKANPQKCYQQLWTGVDVGSTTVKMIVVDNETDEILWQDYQRHDTKQPEKALEMLKAIEAALPNTPKETSAFSLPAPAAPELRSTLAPSSCRK